MSDSSMVAKITVSSIGCTPGRAVEEGKTVAIAQIYGMATGIKEVVDKVRGDVFKAVTGNFEARNLQNGKVFQSGVLYLPAGLHDLLMSAVEQVSKDGSETTSVSFALEIGVNRAKNPAGYSYEGRTLIKAAVIDPLAEIRAAIAATAEQKQLEAPKQDEGANRETIAAPATPAKGAKNR